MSKPTFMRRTMAFTLVELLVVIGIIALLISILLPALGAARRQAQLTQCLSIQRQIAVAAQQHALSHQGFYPLAGFFSLGLNAGVNMISPATLGDPGRRKYSYNNFEDQDILAAWHAALAQYMGKKRSLSGGTDADVRDQEFGSDAYLKFFTCPSHIATTSDLPESLIYADPNSNYAWSVRQSYIVNESVFGINDRLGYLRGNSAKIRQPARVMMLTDGLPGDVATLRGARYSGVTGWATWYHSVVPTRKNLPLTLGDTATTSSTTSVATGGKVADAKSFDKIRHKGKINILYFDGHAETRQIRDSDLKGVCLLAQ